MTVKKPVDKEKKSAAVHVWYGPNEPYLRFEMGRWRDEFKKRHPDAKVTHITYSKDEGKLAAEVHVAAKGGGLFNSKQLIILEGCLGTEKKSELGEAILDLVRNSAEGTFVLMVQTGKTAWSKGTAAAIKTLEGDGVSLKEFAELPPAELEKWVALRAKEAGASFAPGVARLLTGLVGTDLMRLSQEVAKLAAYRQGSEVRAVDLDVLVSKVYQEDAFAFLESVGKRDFSTAAAVLHRQFEEGNSPQAVIGLLAWHVRVLAGVRQVLDKAGSLRPQAREIAGELGLHPFVVTKALQQIPYFSSQRIAWLYDELSRLDIDVKSSRVAPETLFDVFLMKLAAVRAAV